MSTILSIITALVVGGSGVYDFSGPPQVLQLMRDLGYKPGFERSLGIIKLAAAVGLLLSLLGGIVELGLLSSFGLIGYFALAVRAHRRLGHESNQLIPAYALLALSALTFLALLFS
ncbi:MAG: hypothetical protein F2520_02045 [Actinobacteria bacterium]|uniref:Unannotated protein n=1 Tax=freshwater metagenome TaxID=449393 RepID=A0A6J7I2Q6_9ZZZZ|nr:hypothetical protein [Actinomycetota bacterium]MTA77026.1 hypothetical protein [Actinomycetota bacterium]